MSVDPLASMRCWAVAVEIGGQEYEVPALPAADWWAVLSAGDPTLILSMLDGDVFDFDDALLAGQISADELGQVLTETIEQVAGRSLHAAMVLVAVAEAHWSMISGRLARYGFRWDVMPLGAALDAIHLIVMEGLDEKGRTEFERLLIPKKPGQLDRRKAMADFEAMAGPRPTSGARALSSAAPSGGTRSRTPPRPLSRRPHARSDEPS